MGVDESKIPVSAKEFIINMKGASSGLLLQRDSVVVVLVKQIYSVSGIIFAFVNVIATIQSLAQTYNSVEYNDDTLIAAVENNAPHNNDMCSDDPSSMVLYCTYKNQTNYVVFLTLWIIYFVIAILNRLAFTYRFNTADLRFYIAGESCCAAIYTKVWFYIGALFSVITMICIWSNATSRFKDNSYYNEIMVQAFVNAVVTIVGTYDETEFRVLDTSAIDYLQEFKDEVLVKVPIRPSMKNGQGLFHTRFNVFSSITGEMYKDFINNQSDKFVAAIGDAGKVKEYMNRLIVYDSMPK